MCVGCGAAFETPAWRVAQGKGKFCGRSCYHKHSRNEDGLEIDGLWFARSGKNAYYWHKRADKRTVSLHKYVWEKHNGPVPAGYVVHHIDHDTRNNEIGNLELVNGTEHSRYHLQKRIDEGTIDVTASLGKAREAAKHWHRSPEGREWHRQHAYRIIHKKNAGATGVQPDDR